MRVGVIQRITDRQADIDVARPWRATPSPDLRHRRLDIAGADADHRLEPVRVLAAEVVEIAVLGAHELDVDGRLLVPARSASIDQELDVDALRIHVADASIGIPVVALRMRILTPHELAGGHAGGGARLCLTEHARHVGAPAADGTAAAEAEARRVGRVVLNARRVPFLGHFVALQVWY